MRSRISIRGCVRRSVRPSVGPSVRPSVTHELKSCKSAVFDQNYWQYERERILCRVYGLVQYKAHSLCFLCKQTIHTSSHIFITWAFASSLPCWSFLEIDLWWQYLQSTAFYTNIITITVVLFKNLAKSWPGIQLKTPIMIDCLLDFWGAQCRKVDT